MADEKVGGTAVVEPQTSGAAGAGTGASTSTTTSATPGAGGQAYTYGGKTYNSVEDLGKAYESANSELGKWTQQYGDLEKRSKQYEQLAGQAQQWNQWWQTIQPLWGDDVEQLLKAKLTGQPLTQQQNQRLQQGMQQAAAQQQQARPNFEEYELLRPSEQFSRFRDQFGREVGMAVHQHVQQQLGQLQQGIAQALKQKEDWYQNYLSNYLGLFRKAFERKLSDPSFNVDAVMEQAAKAMSGQFDPLELGQQLITASQAESALATAKKEAYAQAKKDFEDEQKNKKMETVPPSNGQAPTYKVRGSGTDLAKTRRGGSGLASMRDAAAQNLATKYGSGLFLNE